MSEKHSIVIEEYLLLLYQLRGAGERLKAVTLAQRLKSSAPRYMLPCSACSEMI